MPPLLAAAPQHLQKRCCRVVGCLSSLPIVVGCLSSLAAFCHTATMLLFDCACQRTATSAAVPMLCCSAIAASSTAEACDPPHPAPTRAP
jgi:hypothetical protein